MNFKDNAHCELRESAWIDQEQRNCDTHYKSREMNKYCHEVIKRESERRQTICR